MSNCENCGNVIDSIPFNCRRCGGRFCSSCRLLEIHNCSGFKGNIFTRISILHNESDEDEPTLSNKNYNRFSLNKLSDWLLRICKNTGITIMLLLFVGILANIISLIILPNTHLDMQEVMGNPKPLYLYDISFSCDNYDTRRIVSALGRLSDETGVKFIRLPFPVAFVIGGISYGCIGTTNQGVIGESHTGFVGGGAILISWNIIDLVFTDEGTVLHETLHSMGFGHSQNSLSIMNPLYRGNSQIDRDLIDFIRKMYVNNPLAYLNIIPPNLFSEAIFLFVIIDRIRRFF